MCCAFALLLHFCGLNVLRGLDLWMYPSKSFARPACAKLWKMLVHKAYLLKWHFPTMVRWVMLYWFCLPDHVTLLSEKSICPTALRPLYLHLTCANWISISTSVRSILVIALVQRLPLHRGCDMLWYPLYSLSNTDWRFLSHRTKTLSLGSLIQIRFRTNPSSFPPRWMEHSTETG